MDKGCSTVCVLIVALCALVHFGTVFSTVKTGGIFTECPRHLNLALSRKGYEDCPRDHICCVYDGEEVCVPPVSTKPGVCPRRRLDFGHCAEICSNDRDCPNNEKCCSNGCGHECMAPLSECPSHLNLALSRKGCNGCPRGHICCICDGEEVCVPPVSTKPGVCPRRRLHNRRCTKSCSKDRDCPNNEKCCSNGCGHECMAPLSECPRHLNLALSRQGYEDCPRDHICCVYDGEEVCVPPVSTKPGVCPRRRLDFGHCAEICSNDRDCPNNEKCCSNGCGHECMAPVIECPRHLNLALSHKGYEDCPRDHICCVYDGEEVCVPPVSTKPGVCPPRRLDFGHCAEICSNDRDCPNNEKCCSNGCGHECMAPLSECSRHLNLALSRKGYEDCPRGHICCVYDGEEVCVPPAPIKPGVCPHRHLGHGRCLESCFNDRDCPFFEKCCSNGCGHECMAPYKGWLLPSA
uniref:WAP four-disulfide core domain protein 3 isoform X2 n=1 Tax=Maylandia zebra TaxID=106582 RepID=UPI000D30F78E|nr:NF-X1-type zinc finger protein NFXL1 isoform X2 [Maylandia zebra]